MKRCHVCDLRALVTPSSGRLSWPACAAPRRTGSIQADPPGPGRQPSRAVLDTGVTIPPRTHPRLLTLLAGRAAEPLRPRLPDPGRSRGTIRALGSHGPLHAHAGGPGVALHAAVSLGPGHAAGPGQTRQPWEPSWSRLSLDAGVTCTAALCYYSSLLVNAVQL